MNLEELIRTLEKKTERDNEILCGMPVISTRYDERKKISNRIKYIKDFIKFLKKEKYKNYVESVDKYHSLVLNNSKIRIDYSLEESKIKKNIETYKSMQKISDIPKDFPYTPYQYEIEELERVLKVVQENDEKEIKKEKKKRFLEEEKKAENQKEELIEFLLSEELMKIERRKLLQEKESSEIENEDIRKATDLILNCIKESKEEILKEIKKLIKD